MIAETKSLIRTILIILVFVFCIIGAILLAFQQWITSIVLFVLAGISLLLNKIIKGM